MKYTGQAQKIYMYDYNNQLYWRMILVVIFTEILSFIFRRLVAKAGIWKQELPTLATVWITVWIFIARASIVIGRSVVSDRKVLNSKETKECWVIVGSSMFSFMIFLFRVWCPIMRSITLEPMAFLNVSYYGIYQQFIKNALNLCTFLKFGKEIKAFLISQERSLITLKHLGPLYWSQHWVKCWKNNQQKLPGGSTHS